MRTPVTPALDPEEDPVLARSTLSFPVVGIGASAGGLAAVGRLLENMPAESGMAFVVVLHLAPDHHSTADAIFQRSTRMPVRQVTDDLSIEPNHVYLIPPGKLLSMNDGHLRLGPLERPRGHQHVAIDLLFRSLGEVHRERAVAIVLSGAGADGTQGLRRVKERGGVTLVQSPADAEHDAMPCNAIASGLADFVLPAADMAQKLVELWDNARRIELPRAPADMKTLAPASPAAEQTAEQALQGVMRLLHERTGHDFSHYKRATVLRRIERRMQVTRQPTLPAYAAYLQADVQETAPLLQDMLISVTNFFRDRQAFEALERVLMDELAASRPPRTELRAWVAGCATGEEAYSVAMLLLEHGARPAPPAVQVFATDIDERALAVGRKGLYASSIVTDVPPVRLRQFFDRDAGQYRVAKALREKVAFSVHNLLRDPPFSRLDLVCCRNLLIYLDREAQAKLLEVFHFATRPGGLLFLGSAETADAASGYFTVIDRKHRLYRANAVAERKVPAALSGQVHRLMNPSPLTGTPRRRQQVLDDLHQQLLAEYAPASVVVDRDLKAVHLSEHVGRFMQLRGGEASVQIHDLVLPELRLSLRAAIGHARKTREAVEARRVRLQRGDKGVSVSMLVRPVRHPQAGEGWLLVLFNEADATLSDEAAASSTADPLAAQLERELLDLHERLSSTIDESDDSTEALRAANEELQSLNEELRSTTEELETSKEELQSLNEELMTVNQELKLNAEDTAKANDDLKNLIASNDIATVFVDRALRIQRFTPRAATIFNLLGADVGRPLLDITHRLDYDRMEDDAREAFASLRPIEREVRGNDGRWFLARVLPYRTGEDRIEGAVLNFIDITARHEAEEKARAGEERMRLVVESAEDYAIITTDPQGRVTSWNKGAERTFGYTEAEMTGRPLDLIFTPEDLATGAAEDERRGAREHGRAHDERWHVRKDGSRVYCSGILTPLAGDATKGYAKIARDLTQAQLAEQQRDALLISEQSLRAQLQTAGKMKDEFLAVMSHELKNPLNLIALNAHLLARQPETAASATLARIARTISAGVMSQTQLIDDLLDLSRVQTGKLSLHREEVRFDQVVEHIVEAVTPDAEAQNLSMSLRVGEGDFLLQADPVRLEQIVWNLVSNAIKFTPAGGSVSVRLTTDADMACLTVADTGHGIEPDFLPHVFEMFSQADGRPTTRGRGGLGIGLALVKRLAEAHGGRVAVASAGLGKGAAFTVWLPRRTGGPSRRQARSAPVVKGKRILLIDDERETLNAFAALLQAEGTQLTVAASAEEALEHAAPDRFDLIVSDIAMPGMDGYTLLKRLREAGLQGVPAIAVTGFARPSDRKQALAAGFDEHLGKPLEVEALTRAIGRLADNR